MSFQKKKKNLNNYVIHAMLSVLQFQLLLETGEKSWYSLVPKEQIFAANVQE